MALETGIPYLDRLLKGGVRKNKSILFIADPGVQNIEFAQQFLFHRLTQGDKGLYFVNNKPPSILREQLKDYGWDMSIFEKKGKFYFIDGFSCITSQSSSETLHLQNANNFGQLQEVILKAFQRVENSNTTFIFDSLSSLADASESIEDVLLFVEYIQSVAASHHTTPVFLFTNWPYEKKFLQNLRKLFYYIVDLKAVERKVIVRNYFTLTKLDGKKDMQKKEIPFKVLKPGGVRVYIPKILVTGPFNAGKTSFVHSASVKAVSVDRLGTTVALDHGKVMYQGILADLFGTPGHERFDPILEMLGGEALGVVIVIDSTDPKSFSRAKDMLHLTHAENLPAVVAANKANMPGALSSMQIRKKMRICGDFPIIPVAVEDTKKVRANSPCQLRKKDIRKVLDKLFEIVV